MDLINPGNPIPELTPKPVTGLSPEKPYTACLIEGYEAAEIIRYETLYKTVPDGGNDRYNVKVDCDDYNYCVTHGMVCPGYMYVDEEFIRLGRSYVRAPYCGFCGEIKRNRKDRYSIVPDNPDREPLGLFARFIAFLKSLIRKMSGNQ